MRPTFQLLLSAILLGGCADLGLTYAIQSKGYELTIARGDDPNRKSDFFLAITPQKLAELGGETSTQFIALLETELRLKDACPSGFEIVNKIPDRSYWNLIGKCNPERPKGG